MNLPWQVRVVVIVSLVAPAARAGDGVTATRGRGPLPSLAPATRGGDGATSRKAYIPAFPPPAFLTHVRYLADDQRGGRFPGTPGIEQAADYIARRFREFGLEPAGANGTYFQPFTVRAVKQFDAVNACLEITGDEAPWIPGEDFVAFPFSPPGQVEAPLAFAGYGIHAPEHGYSDYAGFDAAGKVLLILRYEPLSAVPKARFGGKSPSSHALFARKAQVARERGAVALLIVDSPTRSASDELYEWTPPTMRATYALPMLHIRARVAEAILRRAGLPPLETLARRLDENRESLSTDLGGLSACLHTGVLPVRTRNVVGLLRGTEQRDEYIVVGAHYDHLGRFAPPRSDGEPQVYNGADDNASGTSAMLELARALARGPRPRRSVLFVAFSAEEEGLVGSRHFVTHCPVPLTRVRAMVNFDMVGRFNQHQFSVWGVPSAREFADLVRRAAAPLHITYSTPPLSVHLFRQSDHYPFYEHGIPVLFPFTGLHEQYHRPEDDWNRIDAEGAANVLRFAFAIVNELANLEHGPTFVPPASQPTTTSRPSARTKTSP